MVIWDYFYSWNTSLAQIILKIIIILSRYSRICLVHGFRCGISKFTFRNWYVPVYICVYHSLFSDKRKYGKFIIKMINKTLFNLKLIIKYGKFTIFSFI